MPVHNADIAAVFAEIGDLLDIRGANPFRVRAYRNAAHRGELGWDIRVRLSEKGELPRLPGIGETFWARSARS
jgi:DNA polymerase (family 10)